MRERRFILTALVFSVILSISAFAQYEALTGITADSMEYNNYKMCIDSCGQCEQNCKTNAYRMAADTQQKEEFCNYLPEAEKQPCLNRIYMAKAITSKDTGECEKITEENEKKGCLLNVQTEKAITAENDEECSSLEVAFAESCRQAFYMRMASLKNEESYCEKISNENAKTICKSSIAIIAESPAPEAQAAAEEAKGISKSLIIYGIIILGVITAAVIAAVIIKKVGGKKPVQAPPLVVQKQKFPPLVMQSQQDMPPQAQQGEKR